MLSFKLSINCCYYIFQDNQNENNITLEDRQNIKNNIVELMISVPERIQLQISDALSIIAKEDFPEQWQTLIPVSI